MWLILSPFTVGRENPGEKPSLGVLGPLLQTVQYALFTIICMRQVLILKFTIVHVPVVWRIPIF